MDGLRSYFMSVASVAGTTIQLAATPNDPNLPVLTQLPGAIPDAGGMSVQPAGGSNRFLRDGTGARLDWSAMTGGDYLLIWRLSAGGYVASVFANPREQLPRADVSDAGQLTRISAGGFWELTDAFATRDYVDGLVNPVQTHTNYIAISEDDAFTPGEFTTDATGNESMTTALVVPDFAAVSRYIAIAVPDVEGDITDITQSGVSIFGAWERIAGTIAIGGEDHKVWRTTDTQNDLASGITYVIVQA